MADFQGNDVAISGSLIVSGSTGGGSVLEVPFWDYSQVLIGTYPPAGALMAIENLAAGTQLFYSDGSAFWLVELT
jgi:hypothetical protein